MKSFATILQIRQSRKQMGIHPFRIFEKAWYRIRVYQIRIASWEYWPMWVVYLPVSFYYILLSIKAKSFFFFSSANPSIETGGMFFESKWSIFKLLPQNSFPSTILVNIDDDINGILENMKETGIEFPAIAKPDRGERGWCVKRINSVYELIQYKQSVNVPFLIQLYVDYPVELSVFYSRNPLHNRGEITSVTLKKMLSISGDGFSNVNDLIKKNNRSFLQYDQLRLNRNIDFNQVLPKGKELELVPYGNHVRGAMFLNYNHIIDKALTDVFDSISKQIDGFYFGRFDLRCTSIEDLKSGKGVSILELNGSGAEPAHIYDPSFSFIQAQVVIARHYKMMFDAAMENKKRGFPFMSYQKFRETRKREREYKRKIGKSWE
jgi:hypothetical protein